MKKQTILTYTEKETLDVIEDREVRFPHIPLRIADVAYYCGVTWGPASVRVKNLLKKKLIKKNKKGEISLN